MYISTPRRNLLVRFMSVFLLWFSFSAFSEIDQTGKQKVTVIAKNETLESVFKQIEKQTGLRFMYASDAVDVIDNISVEFKNIALDDILGEILGTQGLEWTYRERVVSIRKSKNKKNIDVSKDGNLTVTGKIIDGNGHPIPGATIIIKGSNKGTKSDNDGGFLLAGVDEHSILVVRHLGFGQKEVSITHKTLIIRLDELPGVLDETVVVGYGLTTQRFNTGNVTSIKGEEIMKNPVSDPLLALQGKVPGMVVSQTTGLAGGEVKVQIRGQNSLRNGTVPLFIIDGVPYQPNVNAPTGGSYGALGTVMSALNFINPGDIESIDVLKDADATAIYGSRGANGVVLITTKKGRIGEAKIDISVSKGWQSLSKKRDLLNTREYLEMRREAFKNDNIVPSDQNAPDLVVWDTTRYTDWQEELLGRSASYTDAQLSASGGVSSVQYTFGGNFHRETTIYPGDFSNSRGGLHFNIIGNSSDQRLRTSLTGSYSIDKTNIPGLDFASSVSLPPNAPNAYNQDGTLNWENSTWDKPYAQLSTNVVDGQVNSLVGNVDLSYRIIEGLIIRANLGYTETRNSTFSAYLIAGLPPQQAASARASAGYTNVKNTNWISEPQLTYNKSFGESQLNFLLGTTLLGNSSDGNVLYTDGIQQDALVRYPGAATSYVISGIGRKYKYMAFFSRLGYTLKEKYILNLTLRRDGSSRFGPRNQFANFGSLGMGWIFSEEAFIKRHFSILSFGKLRGSYGITGNDQIGDYQYLDQYKFVENTYQGEKGLRVQGLYNPDFAWERTRKAEIAVELGFWNNKILINSSYYSNYSNNQLASYELPIMAGASTVMGNVPIGIRNNGIEIVISSQNIKSKLIEWSTTLNVSRSRNKLLSDYQSILGAKRVGRAITEIFTYEAMGVNPETGAYQFASQEGKPVNTDEADGFFSHINPNINFLGGIQNSLSVKQFQLDVFFQFTKQIGLNSEYDPNWLPGKIRNQPQSITSRWRQPGDASEFQRVSQNFSVSNNYAFWSRSSNDGYGDASFIRCKNVMLSWIMPSEWQSRLHVKMFKIFIQGQNLFTLTKYKGWDPETQTVNAIPPLRVLNAGFHMTF